MLRQKGKGKLTQGRLQQQQKPAKKKKKLGQPHENKTISAYNLHKRTKHWGFEPTT